MKGNHLQRAGEASLAAHDEWLTALRAPADSDESRTAQAAGDAAWDEAVTQLRWCGINGQETRDPIPVEPEPTVDFAGLERAAAAHRDAARSAAARTIFSGLMIAVLSVTTGYFVGKIEGRDAGKKEQYAIDHDFATLDRIAEIRAKAKAEIEAEDRRADELRALEKARKEFEKKEAAK